MNVPASTEVNIRFARTGIVIGEAGFADTAVAIRVITDSVKIIA
jgi:ribosomal protein S3